MNEELDEITNVLRNEANSLDPDDQKALTKILTGLVNSIFRKDISSNSRKETLRQISNYTLSKSRRITQEAKKLNEISILEYRNRYFHGLMRDPRMARKFYSQFWSLLEKNAQDWNQYELSNLLSYCLRTEPILINLGKTDPLKLVRIFKSIFNAQDEDQKIQTFDELMMRFLTEPKFKKAIELEHHRI
ncbi:hypothetical protein RF679_13395 [Undibacterium cyanobacteriorum]|uniref:Uncharacterized protein n=1 Tax=Undibacterium cyanobacteriorum TaxID=3073561 RepID=A0ABY9REI8_9BURK|nr:hypothetical protein [Undibacterium sp. 20NA77.5]WMW79640.1 hypothetical protein RF679_13395 [Undibacterium sp. 20NA77.5]